MAKMSYVKPELVKIALSSEERLATCEYYYKTGLARAGCHDSFFDDIDPATCLVMTTPQSIS